MPTLSHMATMNARLFVATFDSRKNQGVDNSDMKLLIREIRDALGMTGEQLAEKAGLSRSYLTEIENGTKTANTRRLEAIARALGVQPEDLIEKPDVSEPLSKVIQGFCSLPESRRKIVLDLIDSLHTDSAQAG